MPKALTHTSITWAFSPTVAQVLGVTPGPPCAQGVSGTPHGEVGNTNIGFVPSSRDSTDALTQHRFQRKCDQQVHILQL